jgi:hypothetical protein
MKRGVLTAIAAIATVAVIAGGAAAAGRYLITSTKQIKPSVVKQLEGKVYFGMLYGTFSGPTATMCAAGTDTTGSCETASSDARCPDGGFVESGGFDGGNNPPIGAGIGYDEPDSDGRGWHIIMANLVPASATFHAVALCSRFTTQAARDARAGVPSSVRVQISHELAAARTHG